MKKKITLSTAITLMFVAMTVTFCLTMIASSRLFEAKVQSVNEKEVMTNGEFDFFRRSFETIQAIR